MWGGVLDAGSAAAAAGSAAAAAVAAASLQRRMCDDACMEGQQEQLNSLLEPRWSGGRGQGQEDSVPQALDLDRQRRQGGRQLCFTGAQ